MATRHHANPPTHANAEQVALNLVLQLVLPLAWDALMLRTFAPEVYRAIAAARRGRRVDVAGEEMVDQSEEDEDAEENGSKEALAVDNSVLVGNLAKAMGAWALLYLDVVPWENAVAMLSLDPAELAVQALKKQEEEVVAETGEQLSLPLHGSTVNRVE